MIPPWPAAAPGWWQIRRGQEHSHARPYAARLLPLLQPLGLRILFEPGRFISGNAGVLVTRVEYLKRTGKKNFVIVDAAMNDLIRPAFYDAYHEIVPLPRNRAARHQGGCRRAQSANRAISSATTVRLPKWGKAITWP